MDKAKRKNEQERLRRYWRIFIPLTIILAVMVKFPLRIDLRELTYDFLFYGTISVLCGAIVMWIHKRYGKNGRRLIIVILLASALSGWQVFDLFILRTGRSPSVLGFGNEMSPVFTDWDGLAWYGHRFPDDKIMCHSLYEQYYGNYLIAVTVRINRDATWFACGG